MKEQKKGSTAPRPFQADRENKKQDIKTGSTAPRPFQADSKDKEAVVVVSKTRGTTAHEDNPLGDDHDHDGSDGCPDALTDT